MRYQQPEPMDRPDVIAALDSGDVQQLCTALISAALHDPDGQWVEKQCLHYANHPDESVRGAALLCFGHIARIHGDLDLGAVLPVLRHAVASGGHVGGRAGDALDDIRMFMPEAADE